MVKRTQYGIGLKDQQSAIDVAAYVEVGKVEGQNNVSVINSRVPDDDMGFEKISEDTGIQCNLTCIQPYSMDGFETEDKAIHYYTGFSNYTQFIMFFNLLGSAAFELEPNCTLIHPKDQLFLTLMKLRQCKEDCELSLLFKISVLTVSRTVTTWINFLYFQLKELDFLPSREVIDAFMPQNFGHKFPSTRVNLDATEVPIQKPSDAERQRATWSSYKHRNTAKTMVGCTPKGAVSFVSDLYGGATSDRQIIERSMLVKPEEEMLHSGDGIMADRGIMVQDLFAPRDVIVNTPTMLRGRSQLEPHKLVKDRRVASKRIHIERVIGLAKSYKTY